MRPILLLLALIVPAGLLHAQSKTLDLYWIDAEGGAATLIVTPQGEAMLVDTGNAGTRDAQRIFDVASKVAGLKQIDTLVTTHYHGDHIGGLPELAKMIPIRKFIDHGTNIEATAGATARGAQLWQNYLSTVEGRRTTLKAGDSIALKGMKVQVVSAAGDVISKPINGGKANTALCTNAVTEGPKSDPENSQSLGILLTYNRFTFLDLGDLTWPIEHKLACPDNKVGEVTVFQATHHGFFGGQSGAPQLYLALHPQVVIVNNGPNKGLNPPEIYEEIASSKGIEGIWQLHKSLRNDAAHNTNEQMIANLEPTNECKGNYVKMSVSADGSYTVTNSRNGFSKSYKAR